MVVTAVMISYCFLMFEQFELDGCENCDDFLLFSDV